MLLIARFIEAFLTTLCTATVLIPVSVFVCWIVYSSHDTRLPAHYPDYMDINHVADIAYVFGELPVVQELRKVVDITYEHG